MNHGAEDTTPPKKLTKKKIRAENGYILVVKVMKRKINGSNYNAVQNGFEFFDEICGKLPQLGVFKSLHLCIIVV